MHSILKMTLRVKSLIVTMWLRSKCDVEQQGAGEGGKLHFVTMPAVSCQLQLWRNTWQLWHEWRLHTDFFVTEPAARRLRQSRLAWNMTLCVPACKGRISTPRSVGPPKELMTAEEETGSLTCYSKQQRERTRPTDRKKGSEWRQFQPWVKSRKAVHINLFAGTYSKCLPAEVSWQ